MDECAVYEMGRAAFSEGRDRLSCPFPAPYAPPRSKNDEGLAADCDGAYWLDGFEFEQARHAARAKPQTDPTK